MKIKIAYSLLSITLCIEDYFSYMYGHGCCGGVKIEIVYNMETNLTNSKYVIIM